MATELHGDAGTLMPDYVERMRAAARKALEDIRNSRPSKAVGNTIHTYAEYVTAPHQAPIGAEWSKEMMARSQGQPQVIVPTDQEIMQRRIDELRLLKEQSDLRRLREATENLGIGKK